MRQLGEDLPAALRLAQQQRGILGMRAVGRQFARQFLGDDGDRRQRAAEFVRRRRGQRADRRDALLARQRQLGRRHRVAQPPRLLRDAPGVAADEHVAMTSAVQMPITRSGGKTGGSPATAAACAIGQHGDRATASTASAMTGRRDNAVAATVTGARIRIENGFSRPPVR